VRFQSHIDGAEVALSPQKAIQVQRLLGGDIIMQLDECPPGSAGRQQVAEAVRRSAEWAETCKNEWLHPSDRIADESAARQAMFGIQQGGTHADLRRQSAAALVELELPGYAIGGLSVGEGHEAMCDVLEAVDEQFPRGRPRYLMGVGEPQDIFAAVQRGIDMFDCVLPTRNGRNAQAFTSKGRIRLRNARWAEDTAPLDEACDCYACRNFSRGALRHLFLAKEMLAPTLVSIHNLHFFARFMASIRQAIESGTLTETSKRWLANACCDRA
jgi:queuine tRNA-ribosyltransferase